MSKLRFLATFLVLFALLLFVWSRTDGSRWYAAGLLAVASAIGPPIHGWVLETGPDGPVWAHGENKVRAAIQFDALAVSVVPAVALLAATPGLGLRRRALLVAAGTGLCFVISATILALFPVLVFYQNPFTDIIGTFLGLVAFVGTPVIVWVTLTFPELRRVLPALQRRESAAAGRPS